MTDPSMRTNAQVGLLKVAERFTAPGDEIERLMYGYGLTCCLPDGMSSQPSIVTVSTVAAGMGVQ